VGRILIAGMASLLICIFLGPKFIDYLREKEFGQQIREEGPEGHHGKAGTPTMGGIVLFIAVCVPFLILTEYRAASIAVFGTALASAGLGFADDWIKLQKKRSLGISGRTKLIVQALIAVGLWLFVTKYVKIEDTLRLRVVDASIDLGAFYPVLIFLVLAGATNGVNLTDGLDGLAAGCAAIVMLAFTAMTFITHGQRDLALLSSCLVGACVGFLWFNSFPAAVFMGDTGSLGLGGAIAGMAVLTQTEVLLLIIGGIFVIEALSVAIQVLAFQRFRKRVFLMAPIHHHFELLAWSETKIILRFWIVAAICSAIGFTLYQQSIT
jgi:phospho-N-acetylmuramoyl-pentapeptide-transferase